MEYGGGGGGRAGEKGEKKREKNTRKVCGSVVFESVVWVGFC